MAADDAVADEDADDNLLLDSWMRCPAIALEELELACSTSVTDVLLSVLELEDVVVETADSLCVPNTTGASPSPLTW